MAMYDESKDTVTSALQGSSKEVFSDETIAKILALTTGTGSDSKVNFSTATPDSSGKVVVEAGAEVVYVASSDTVQTTLVVPKEAPVVIFQGKGGVSATIGDGVTTVHAAVGTPDRIVVGTTGADKIVIGDNKNSQVTIGEGDTVVAGAGNDTIVAGVGNSTVAGGTGHAIVEIKGKAADYVVTIKDGHAIVTNSAAQTATDISKIQFVQLDDGKALIFAADTQQAAVTTLYETTFGRTADANGLKYWFDMAKTGASLGDIAKAFTNTAEFSAKAALSDAAFVSGLYQQTFGRAGDTGGATYWANALNQGTTRADLIQMFSQIAANSIAGTGDHVEATVVGSVTIIHNII